MLGALTWGRLPIRLDPLRCEPPPDRFWERELSLVVDPLLWLPLLPLLPLRPREV
jgi:hypothetical protein